MSISPLPNLPSELVPESEGIRLSVLDSYYSQPGTLTGVSFWPRVGARLIDMVIHNIIAVCSGFLVGIMLSVVALLRHIPIHEMTGAKSSGFVLFTLALLGIITFEAICEGYHGSTPGKLILSMVVVQEDGTPCRPGSAWIRSFAYIIDSLFFGLIGYFSMEKSSKQQRHGDEWAETIVCRRSEVAPENLRGPGQFAVVFILASLADAALIIVGAVLRHTT
jgi:uncharacterized RDD family membrane protein YckC